ncbi:MAG: serpin family protein [Parabacteroides sp.]|nr:serpin family protein [Parabacteroides sp.]
MKTTLLSAILFTFCLLSCTSDDGGDFGKDTPRYDIPLSTKSGEINTQVQKFSFDFYREIAKSEKNKENFCISPLSASLCLGMILNGADGNTYTEMQKTLGFEGFTNQQINEYVKMMQTELPKLDGRTIFTNANSLWVNNSYTLLPEFIQTNKTYYDAEVSNEPFDNSTLEKINSWCKQKTNGLIPEIIDKISDDMVSYLINTIYFKGVWTNEFKKSDTKDEPFYLANGGIVKVPTMKQTQSNNYYVDKDVQVVELPYGNESFSMVLFIPTDPEKKDIDKVIADLDRETWINWNENMYPVNMTIYLPRFVIQTEKDLIGSMKVLGIQDVFYDYSANFTKMSTTVGLYIDLLKQKTFIELNESGTEAAAVTIGGTATTSVGPSQSAEIRFDHPFGYVLKEKSTGAILFAGKVGKPE